MNKLLFPLVLLLASLPTTEAEATVYNVDPTHSTVGFRVGHLGISKVTGHFAGFSGSFAFDPQNPAATEAAGQVVVKSIDTDQQKRDEHLRGPEFFDVAQYPIIDFKLTSVTPLGQNRYQATGNFTMHGVSKPITLEVAFGGSVKDPWGNERAAFTASTKLNRKDFGLTWNKVLETGGLLVGDEVEITLEIEGIAAK